MAKRDAILSILVAAVAAAYLISATRIPVGAGRGDVVGPRTFPYLIGASLLVVSMGWGSVQLVRWRRAPSAGPRAPEAEPEDAPSAAELVSRSGMDEAAASPESAREWPRYRHVVMFGATVIYVALLGVLGFVIPTAAYVAGGVLIIGGLKRYPGVRLLVPVAFGAAASGVLYLLFAGALNVALPQGLLA